VSQPRSAVGTVPSPLHSRYVDALRPACASWIAATAPWPWMKSTMRAHASRCASFQMPVSHGEMRPSGSTAVASLITRPAPPRAKEPRWTRCQSFGMPSLSSHEYWHSGLTHRRLRVVTERIARGENRADVIKLPYS